MNKAKTVKFSDNDVIKEFMRLNKLNDVTTALNDNREKVVIIGDEFSGEYDPYVLLVHMKLKDRLGKKIIDIHRNYLKWKIQRG